MVQYSYCNFLPMATKLSIDIKAIDISMVLVKLNNEYGEKENEKETIDKGVMLKQNNDVKKALYWCKW